MIRLNSVAHAYRASRFSSKLNSPNAGPHMCEKSLPRTLRHLEAGQVPPHGAADIVVRRCCRSTASGSSPLSTAISRTSLDGAAIWQPVVCSSDHQRG